MFSREKSEKSQPLFIHRLIVLCLLSLVLSCDGERSQDPTSIGNQLPSAQFSIDNSEGSVIHAVSFDASSSADPDGSIEAYLWDFGDNTSATGIQVNHNYTSVGTYSVTLSVVDDNAAQVTSSAQVISVIAANVTPSSAFSLDTDIGFAQFTVRFDASTSSDSDGSISAYTWDFGDNTTGTGQTLSHTYTDTGVYLSFLSVTDNENATNISSARIIRVLPPNLLPSATFIKDATSINANIGVNFDAVSSTDADGSIVLYVWDFGDGTSGVGQQVNHIYTAQGNYAVTLTVTDDSGSRSTSSAQSITVLAANQPPTAMFTTDINNGSSPLTISFNATTSSDIDGTISTYSWNFGDATTGAGSIINHTYSAPGIYLAFLTVTDDLGATNSQSSNVINVQTSTTAPTAIYSVIRNALQVSFDASASTDVDGSIVSYSWSFGDGSTDTGVTVSHTYASAGSYSTTLTVVDNSAEQGTSNVQLVTVLTGNLPPTATFTKNVISGDTPLTVNFDASASNDEDGSIAGYAWNFGDGTADTGQTPSHIYNSSGTFLAQVTVTDSSGSATTSNLQSIQVSAPNISPVAAFTTNINPIPARLSLNFDASSSTDADGIIAFYIWDFGDGNVKSGLQVSHTYASPGNYLATLTITDTRGGQDTSPPQTINVIAGNSSPNAAFTIDTDSGSSPLTVRFDATTSSDSDGSISSYDWNFGDGTNATGQLAAHTYSAEGTYAAYLIVTDNAGATNYVISPVIRVFPANDDPVAGFSVNTNNLTTTFDASASTDNDGSIISYLWDFGDGSTATGEQVTHIYNSASNFVVSLTVTDNDGAQNANSSQLITVLAGNTPPSATFTVNTTTGNSPLAVNFDASASTDADGSISTYAWDFGDGTTGSGQTVSHTYVTNGVFLAFVTVTDDAGDSTVSTPQFIRTVPPNIVPSATFSVNTNNGKAALSVTFDASSSTDTDGSIIAYNWDFGDGTTALGQSVNYTYTTPGNYSATLRVTDDSGAQNTSSAQVISVDTANILPVARFSLDVASGINPVTVNFNAASSSDSDGNVSAYVWDFGDGTLGSGVTATHTYAVNGVYLAFLTVTDNDADKSVSAAQVIRVLPINVFPSAAFVVDKNSGDTPLTVNFDASSSADTDGSITNYNWDFGDGSAGIGQQLNHTYTSVGNFSASLTVTDNDGAQHTSGSQSISVTPGNILPTASFSVDASTGSNPLTVNFDGSSSTDSDGTISNYDWDFGDGTTASGQTIGHSYSTIGVYLAYLTVTDNSGGSSISSSQIMRVLPPNADPIAAFTVDVSSGTVPLAVAFDGSNSSDTDGTINTYEWNFGDGGSATGAQVNYTYLVAGNYTATLTVIDNNGAKGTSTLAITAQLSTTLPTSSFTVDVDTGDAPLTVAFDASASSDPDGSITNYAWDFGDGTNDTGITTSHIYATVGTYSATLTVTDDSTNSTLSPARTINAQAINALPTASFTVDTSSGTSPALINFDAITSIDTDGSIVDYVWDFGDGATGGGALVSHTYYLDGNHTASLTVTDDRGGQNTFTQSITITANGGANITGNIYSFSAGILDTDINDLNSTYLSNNTTATAQTLLTPQLSLTMWGYVTKTATGISGQRFENIADEVDIYRISMAKGQDLYLYIRESIDLNGVENGNDLDLYLYSVNDTQTPVDSSIGTGSTEGIVAPEGGDYYLVVSAFRGGSSYRILSYLTTELSINKQRLSLSDSFINDEVIAKLKPQLKPEKTALTQQKTAQSARSVHDDHNIILKRGHSSRGSLFGINKSPPVSQNKSAAIQVQKAGISPQDNSQPSVLVDDALFDGRYGIGLSKQDRQAYETIKTIKRLRADNRVEYANPNYLLHPLFTPNDTNYALQWHYPAINLPQAWDITTGVASVIVAVIDTGVFLAHEDLSGNLLSTGYDFISSDSNSGDSEPGIDNNPDDPGDSSILAYSSWHGTHVSGTIAASSNNSLGVSGVAHDVSIMPIRVLGLSGGSSYDIQQAILYAAGLSNDSGTVPPQPADIINMSLGGSGYNQSTANAINLATAAGTIVIAAAGNDNSGSNFYPASYPGVVSVSAVGQGNEKASYSNFGPNIDISAPGGDRSIDSNGDGKADDTVLSTLVDTSSGSRQSGYAMYQGTSMASPHIAGVVALMKSVYSELSPALLDVLIANGDLTTDLSGDGPNNRNDSFGYGLIDALKAVQKAQDLANGETPPIFNNITLINQFNTMLTSNQQTISIYKVTGSVAVSSITLNFPWATMAAQAVDADGMGDYTLDIDRTGLADGLYELEITFILDNAEQYTSKVSVVEYASSNDDSGTVYLTLIDSSTLNVVVQTQQQANTSTPPDFIISNVPDGTYLLYAGTDFDGDRKIEDSELFGAHGGTDTPTIITVTGTDIDISSAISITSYDDGSIDLID